MRIRELAGTSHTDTNFYEDALDDKDDEPSFALVKERKLNCEFPISSGPAHWVFNAAIRAISGWVSTGAVPPHADRLAPFDAANMTSLYVDKHGYVQAVSDSADEAVTKGFLLPPDAELIKAAAALQWDMLGI